jgi:hypothetical protein
MVRHQYRRQLCADALCASWLPLMEALLPGIRSLHCFYYLPACALPAPAEGIVGGVRVGAIVGTCEAMCPAPERERRARLSDIQVGCCGWTTAIISA